MPKKIEIIEENDINVNEENISDDDAPLTKPKRTKMRERQLVEEEPKQEMKSDPKPNRRKIRTEAQIKAFEKVREIRAQRVAEKKKEKEERMAKIYMESKQREAEIKPSKREEVYESESESEEEYYEPPKKSKPKYKISKPKYKSKPKPKKKVVYLSSSSEESETDSEEEEVVIRRKPTRQPVYESVIEDDPTRFFV